MNSQSSHCIIVVRKVVKGIALPFPRKQNLINMQHVIVQCNHIRENIVAPHNTLGYASTPQGPISSLKSLQLIFLLYHFPCSNSLSEILFTLSQNYYYFIFLEKVKQQLVMSTHILNLVKLSITKVCLSTSTPIVPLSNKMYKLSR